MEKALYTIKCTALLIVLFVPRLVLGMDVNGAHKQGYLQVHVQDVRPYAYVDGVEAVGPIMDNLRNIEKRTHHDLNVILTPHKRILKELDMKHANLIVAFNGEKLKDTQEIASLVDFDVAVILRADKHFDAIKKDKNVSIAVVRGTHMGIEALNDNTQYIEVRTYEQGLQLLQKNRVDAVMGIQDELGTAVALLDSERKALIGTAHIVDSVSAKIYVPNEFKAEPYVQDIKQTVDAMKRDGTLVHLPHSSTP